MSAPDTFPKRLLEHARLRPDRAANYEKDYGIWQSWTWAQVTAEVEAFGRLPHGLQKRVELGRALAIELELLLLDEPMAGMFSFILDIHDESGTTIALIEHDMGW